MRNQVTKKPPLEKLMPAPDRIVLWTGYLLIRLILIGFPVDKKNRLVVAEQSPPFRSELDVFQGFCTKLGLTA